MGRLSMSNIAFIAFALLIALFGTGLVMCVLLYLKLLDTDKDE